MRWHEVTVNTTEEAIEMVTNFIHELGAGGVSIEESGTLNKKRDTSLGQWYDELPLNNIPEGRAVIKGYFVEGTELEPMMNSLKQSIEQLSTFGIETGNPTFELKLVDDEDWANAWKQYFKPMRISNKLTIKPTWETYHAENDEIVLELDPGMAFGTGTHATTALCLRALEQVVKPGDHVIDVGTGSGILAIAAAKLGAEQVLAIDLDPVAVSSATENARLNGMLAQIQIQESDLLKVIHEPLHLQVKLPVQLVVANILAEIILLFVQDVYDVLEHGGLYVISGVIEAKREQVEQGLMAVGFTIERVAYETDWVVIIARKK